MASAAVPAPRGGIRGGLGRALRDSVRDLAEAVTTPRTPEDFLDRFFPLRPTNALFGSDLRARIVSVTPETRDAATIVLKPGSDWAGHTPGQFTRIGIDVDGVRQWRAYSLTHGPHPDGLISITVKAVPGGKVSPYLVHQARPGTIVHLDQAQGEFVLPERHGKLLFVTAGSGITPVIGMLRNLFPVTDSGVLHLRRSRDLDIVVVHVAPSEPESIFIANLRELDDAGVIRLVPHYDDVHGGFNVDDLAGLVPDLDERTTYACGPHGLLDALEGHHDRMGVALYTEQFRLGQITPSEGGSVAFDGRVVDAPGDRPILDVAEEAGVTMPSGCRMGICFSCVLPLKEGAVRDLRNGTLTVAVPGETGPNGIPIQTCISAAAGACIIDNQPKGAQR